MEPITQLRFGLHGDIKTGKTTFATVDWPKPLVHYDLDLGFDRAEVNLAGYKILKVPAGQPMQSYLNQDFDIMVKPYPPVIRWGDKPHGQLALWNSLADDLLYAHESSKVATIVIDTASAMLKLRNAAQLELVQRQNPERQNLIQIEYGPRNDDMRGAHSAAKAYGKNLVLVHHDTGKYENRLTESGVAKKALEGKGMLVLWNSRDTESVMVGTTWDGFGEMGRYVDVIARTEKISMDGARPSISMVIEVCGYALGFEGHKVEGASFEAILALLNYYRSQNGGEGKATA